MSRSPARRPLVVALAGLLAPLGGCFVSGGDGSPSALVGDNPGHGGWNGRAPGGGNGYGGAGGSDGGSASAACTMGATSAFTLEWSVSGVGDNDTSGDAGAGASGDAGMAASDAATDGAGADTSDGGSPSDAASSADAATPDAAAAAPGASACAAAGATDVGVDVTNLVSGAESSTIVPCGSMSITTCPLPRGSYSVKLDLRDGAGATLSEILAPELDLGSAVDVHVPSLPFEVGGLDATMARGFALTWSIETATSGVPRTCADAGAATVRLKANNQTFDLPCAPGAGRTPTLVAGEYSVSLALLDAQGAALSVTGSMIIHVENGQLVFLGAAVFDVD